MGKANYNCNLEGEKRSEEREGPGERRAESGERREKAREMGQEDGSREESGGKFIAINIGITIPPIQDMAYRRDLVASWLRRLVKSIVIEKANPQTVEN